jgi:hypothetical protein
MFPVDGGLVAGYYLEKSEEGLYCFQGQTGNHNCSRKIHVNASCSALPRISM